jgi:toxin ParE1/3/4
MDLKIDWSPEAVEDLESIADYICRDSEFYARAVATRVLDVCSGLIEFPYIGRMVPEHGDENIRERIVYGYRTELPADYRGTQVVRGAAGDPVPGIAAF